METRDRYSIINASGYSTSKLHLLKEIFGLSKKRGYAYCSVHTLASKCGIKDRALQYHLSELERDGVLNIEHGIGRNHVNHYSIRFDALAGKGAEPCTISEEQGCSPLRVKGAGTCIEKVQEITPKGADACTQDKRSKYRQDVSTDEKANEPAFFQGVKEMARHSSIIKIWNDWNEAIALKPYKAVVPIPQDIQFGNIRGSNSLYEAIGNWIDAHSDWEELWKRVLTEVRSNRYFDGERVTPSLRMMFVGKPATHTNGKLQEAWRPTIDRVLEGDFDWGRPKVAVNNPKLDVMKKTLDASVDTVKERGFEAL